MTAPADEYLTPDHLGEVVVAEVSDDYASNGYVPVRVYVQGWAHDAEVDRVVPVLSERYPHEVHDCLQDPGTPFEVGDRFVAILSTSGPVTRVVPVWEVVDDVRFAALSARNSLRPLTRDPNTGRPLARKPERKPLWELWQSEEERTALDAIAPYFYDDDPHSTPLRVAFERLEADAPPEEAERIHRLFEAAGMVHVPEGQP